MARHLHIISFDVPFPANYGGVIDVYYKLVALKRQGLTLTLHCFNYGRQPAPELEQWCDQVIYYERKTGFISNVSVLPYTVKSRRSRQLEQNLLKDDDPILFEVLHTCYLLNDARFRHRMKIYRHSNIEHEYYRELSRSERSPLKKLYLRAEAWKLKRFESILKHANLILAVNKKDAAYFKQTYPTAQTLYLPSFHPGAALSNQPGRGAFILFHGNLSVSENYEAAAWLMENVFSKVKHRCVIAGLNPPAFLTEQAKHLSNVEVMPSPTETEMNSLLEEAQVHVLYTPQPTGLKLKLLNVLFKGRFVVCNPHMIAGTDVKENSSLLICHSPQEFIAKANTAMNTDFSEDQVRERQQLVAAFDNEANAKKLIEAVFGEVLSK